MSRNLVMTNSRKDDIRHAVDHLIKRRIYLDVYNMPLTLEDVLYTAATPEQRQVLLDAHAIAPTMVSTISTVSYIIPTEPAIHITVRLPDPTLATRGYDSGITDYSTFNQRYKPNNPAVMGSADAIRWGQEFGRRVQLFRRIREFMVQMTNSCSHTANLVAAWPTITSVVGANRERGAKYITLHAELRDAPRRGLEKHRPYFSRDAAYLEKIKGLDHLISEALVLPGVPASSPTTASGLIMNACGVDLG